MKSITIHKLDDQLDALIREKAKKEKSSLNQTIKKILEESLGLKTKTADNSMVFMDLFGVWTEQDINEFNEAAKEFGKVDPEDWQ